MFTEPQLVSVYHMAFEIEMVYAPTHQERAEFPHLTVDDVVAIHEGVPIEMNNNGNIDQTQQGINCIRVKHLGHGYFKEIYISGYDFYPDLYR